MVIITLGGTPGSGKGTVGVALARELRLPFFSMGDVRRKYALERGMTLAQLNMLCEHDPTNDNEVDAYQAKLPESHPSFVMDSRLGFHFLPKSIKLYLKVDVREGARRIKAAHRDSEKMHTIEQGVVSINERLASDVVRYEKFYGLNPYDESHYDLVVDTTHLTPQQVLDVLIEYLRSRGV